MKFDPEIRYRLSLMFDSLMWRIPFLYVFIYAIAAFFVPPTYMLLLLVVVAYVRSWCTSDDERKQG